MTTSSRWEAGQGTRIGKILYDRVPGEHMIFILKTLVQAIRDHNPKGLPAGDFLYQTPVEAFLLWSGSGKTRRRKPRTKGR